jgi:hypothetical protein
MTNFKALTLATVTALSTFAAPAAQARNVDNAHIRLAHAIVSTGVTLKINPIECYNTPAYGWYSPANREMVVCQETAKGTHEVNWTAEDLDTLRHEAQHLVQDCMNGELDGILGAVYQEPIALGKQVLGEDGIKMVLEAYSEVSDHIKVMEIEAFAVARMNDPMEQVADIAKFCF